MRRVIGWSAALGPVRFSLALLLLVGAQARAEGAGADRMIAVLPLDVIHAKKIDADAQASLEEMIRDVTATYLSPGGWTVMSGQNMLQLLEDNGIDPTKCGEGSCQLSTAREIKAEKFISGAVQYAKGSYTASIRLIDTKKGSILAALTLSGKSVTALRHNFDVKAHDFFVQAGLLKAVEPPMPAQAQAAPATPACPWGYEMSADTQGHCCWPGQAWGNDRCVGKPDHCPEGYRVEANECAWIPPPPCSEPSQQRSNGHCCWPGQAWSGARGACIGEAQCPIKYAGWNGKTCVAFENDRTAASKVEPKSGLEFIRLPGGTYHYGCEPQDKQCQDNEKLGRSVTVQPFWLGKTDATVAAYAKCVSAGACTAATTGGACNWQVGGKENHPINCIDWNQATAFCQWVGGRLPTAEEWEYAAKGGESRVYPWGNEAPDENRALSGKPYDGTAPAESFGGGATKHGLLNMAGNVWQWTANNYDASQKEQRGGSWNNGEQNLRASTRGRNDPSTRHVNLGVRCGL